MSDDTQTINFMSSTSDVLAAQQLGEATSLIDYHSSGHTLVIGSPEAAIAVAEQINARARNARTGNDDAGKDKTTGAGSAATVVTVDGELGALNKQLTETGITVFYVPQLQLAGYLGAFVAVAGESDLAVAAYRESGAFDTVIDLSAEPVFAERLPPFGYYHARSDDDIAAATSDVADMVGEFEKPKYFNYDRSICAHSRSELSGCNNCITVCATGAIDNDGEGINVNPYLCQGCGSCATVCPSGALSYAYPQPSEAISRTRTLIENRALPVLVLYTESQESSVPVESLPGNCEALLVEEVTAFGMDYWASMISSGVQHIVLLSDAPQDATDIQAVQAQIDIFHSLMQGMGVGEALVSIQPAGQLAEVLSTLEPVASLAGIRPARFDTHNRKRQTLRSAMDSLAEQLTVAEPVRTLQSGAPFGVIDVNENSCTLCMACVSTCPAGALLDGQDTPALRMIEANCLQCGLCEQACPESAISLQPQYTYDSVVARKINTLHEESPFNCIRCQKPFATTRIIQSMFDKLDGHWMFKDEAARRRLKMCEDCRVKDIFEHDEKGIDVHKTADT